MGIDCILELSGKSMGQFTNVGGDNNRDTRNLGGLSSLPKPEFSEEQRERQMKNREVAKRRKEDALKGTVSSQLKSCEIARQEEKFAMSNKNVNLLSACQRERQANNKKIAERKREGALKAKQVNDLVEQFNITEDEEMEYVLKKAYDLLEAGSVVKDFVDAEDVLGIFYNSVDEEMLHLLDESYDWLDCLTSTPGLFEEFV